ncbi:transducer protein Htr34 [Natronomonas moolapensis 8.8.11]|uniref:Transducer protein Htr34 n=1 Tax=Natronomonas moolapensis (strain DSM 18674 / CECT 7526 / JCM 14361 / 8.8.11) TaxID=268739 RepID=M1XS23_NATM8|nr:methyl-accepting chemotaxis protein [Natronomonas moolapensis]CCQ37113.1 transducer protein Htr34 [Natronomonas moolapensis 8.8.11]
MDTDNHAVSADANDERLRIEDGLIVNAQGAVDVVHETSRSVDSQLASIREAAGAQVEDMDSVVDDVTDLSATIQEVAAGADEVSETTDRAAAAATEGREATDEAADAMTTAAAATRRVQTQVEALADHVERIDRVVETIDRIADETNLLALNASIEAARADDDAGFSVVAEEVKSLAEESRSETERIEDAVGEIQSVTADVSDALGSAVEAVETGTERIEAAESELDVVDEEMAAAAAGVDEVSTAVAEGADTSTRVADACSATADAARDIDRAVEAIDEERADTTDLLAEIDDALSSVRRRREARLEAARTVPTGIDDFDGGGLPVGSRSVIVTDTTDDPALERTVAETVAECCATAIDAGWAVSLSPPPALEQSTLADALRRHAGVTATDALAGDRLFVLDLFGSWSADDNVIDVTETGLERANERVDATRDRPLFVIGTVAGECELMGEAAARETAYENDGDVLGDDDLVLNVVDEASVSAQLRSFYTGAADRSCRIDSPGGR